MTKRKEEHSKEMFCLTTHSTHLIYNYMVLNIWLRITQIKRLKINKYPYRYFIGDSFRLTAMGLHGGPIELFLVPTSAPRLVKQRPWYVLSGLWDDAYKRTLAANRKPVPIVQWLINRLIGYWVDISVPAHNRVGFFLKGPMGMCKATTSSFSLTSNL